MPLECYIVGQVSRAFVHSFSFVMFLWNILFYGSPVQLKRQRFSRFLHMRIPFSASSVFENTRVDEAFESLS
jgi:hypothetical protein